jgi:Phosphotransferase enzyme family
MTPPPALSALGKAAAQLLVSLGTSVVRAECISPLLSARARKRCYRLDLADGRTVKLRRSSSDREARQYTDLIVALGDSRLARVLGRRGDLTLEEWVPGITLDKLAVSPAHLVASGELLGTLHATRRLGTMTLPREVSTGPLRHQLESDLRKVLGLGAVTGDVGSRVRAAVARHDPRTARTGILHTDLCPENLVQDPGGTIRAIDNEGMRIGATGFDLARVWYRWPMPDAEWRTYLAAYARHCDPTSVIEHFPFWQLAAVLQSACLRLTRRTPNVHVPLERLRALAATL